MRPSISLPVKLWISSSAAILILLHLWFPSLKIDSITLGLLALGAVPWIFAYVDSVKFPGGEVKFRDVEQAGEKITSAAPPSTPAVLASASASLAASAKDPNLALVGLRIEIEKRLLAMARKNQIPANTQLFRLIGELKKRGLLPIPIAEALDALVDAGNKAAHGADVDGQVANWANQVGPQIIAALDNLSR